MITTCTNSLHITFIKLGGSSLNPVTSPEPLKQPRPTTRLSKILSHTSSSDSSVKHEAEVKIEACKEAKTSKEEPTKKLEKALPNTIKKVEHISLYGRGVMADANVNDADDDVSSDETSSDEIEISNLNKASKRNLSSTLASLASNRNVVQGQRLQNFFCLN